jgi:hypothetical protein
MQYDPGPFPRMLRRASVAATAAALAALLLSPGALARVGTAEQKLRFTRQRLAHALGERGLSLLPESIRFQETAIDLAAGAVDPLIPGEMDLLRVRFRAREAGGRVLQGRLYLWSDVAVEASGRLITPMLLLDNCTRDAVPWVDPRTGEKFFMHLQDSVRPGSLRSTHELDLDLRVVEQP